MLARIALLFGSALLVLPMLALAGAVGAPAASERDVIVTRSSVRLPAGCTPRTLASFVDRFFEAFNGREWRVVDALFAASGPRPEDFKLFSWERDVVQERERLAPYLAALRDRGERIRLLSLKVTRESRVMSSVAVEYVFERASGRGAGKGLIDCSSQRIWQWAMGPRPGDVALPCAQPTTWSPSGPIVACTAGPNARALSEDFRLGPTSIELPKRCKPAKVKPRVRAVLVAFNLGGGDDFAKHFLRRGQFHPYTASISGNGFSGRARIARFVSARYQAGDGWTARRLFPPRGAVRVPKWTLYRVELRIAYQGTAVSEPSGANLVVDCATGLLRSWSGPSLRLPSS